MNCQDPVRIACKNSHCILDIKSVRADSWLNGTLAYPLEEPEDDATAQEKQDYETDLARREALTDQMAELGVYSREPEQAVALLAFQQQFNAAEPVIPVYSNIYFDFYPRVLQGYQIADYSSWSQAIVPAFMSDYADEKEEVEEEDVFLD